MIALVVALLTVSAADAGPKLPIKKLTPDSALSALNAARSAVSQADASAESRKEADLELARAEALFERSDFAGAVLAADAAWRLVSSEAREKIRFEVTVAEDGKTEVVSKTGPPVRVEAQGETRVLYPGQKVAVAKNEPPAPVEIAAPVLAGGGDDAGAAAPVVVEVTPPKLTSPQKGQVIVLKGNPKALGPVTLQWKAVPGATKYEVTWKQGETTSPPFETTGTSLKLPKLPKGRYEWTVKALGTGDAEGAKAAVAASHFELQAKDVKLEVEKTTWK